MICPRFVNIPIGFKDYLRNASILSSLAVCVLMGLVPFCPFCVLRQGKGYSAGRSLAALAASVPATSVVGPLWVAPCQEPLLRSQSPRCESGKTRGRDGSTIGGCPPKVKKWVILDVQILPRVGYPNIRLVIAGNDQHLWYSRPSIWRHAQRCDL